MCPRPATTYGVNEATGVSIACYRGAGTAAIMQTAPFERRFRDAVSAWPHMRAMPKMVDRHVKVNVVRSV